MVSKIPSNGVLPNLCAAMAACIAAYCRKYAVPTGTDVVICMVVQPGEAGNSTQCTVHPHGQNVLEGTADGCSPVTGGVTGARPAKVKFEIRLSKAAVFYADMHSIGIPPPHVLLPVTPCDCRWR